MHEYIHDALYVVYCLYLVFLHHLYPDQDARVLQRLNDVTTSGALRGHQGTVVRHAVNLKLLNSDIWKLFETDLVVRVQAVVIFPQRLGTGGAAKTEGVVNTRYSLDRLNLSYTQIANFQTCLNISSKNHQSAGHASFFISKICSKVVIIRYIHLAASIIWNKNIIFWITQSKPLTITEWILFENSH